jgi:hypothetical protein
MDDKLEDLIGQVKGMLERIEQVQFRAVHVDQHYGVSEVDGPGFIVMCPGQYAAGPFDREDTAADFCYALNAARAQRIARIFESATPPSLNT